MRFLFREKPNQVMAREFIARGIFYGTAVCSALKRCVFRGIKVCS
jgi:hypothetical protein